MYLRLLSIFILCVFFLFTLLFNGYFKIVAIILFILFLLYFIRDLFQDEEPAFKNIPVIGRLYHIMHNIFVQKVYDNHQVKYIKKMSREYEDISSFGVVVNNVKSFLLHSNFPNSEQAILNRVIIGAEQCSQPYSSNRINVSALGFGPVSKNMIMSISKAAKRGKFFLNTGEDGITKYHGNSNSDIIYQLGTGYLGCQTSTHYLDRKKFKQKCLSYNVSMIEVKISQGGKPGLGGNLPADKVTSEISLIENVPKNKSVITKPYHKEFSNWKSLLYFLEELRQLSEGKPVGIKLAIGSLEEYKKLFDNISAVGSYPDFITIDGAEGGSGASSYNFFEHVGMPLIDSLIVTKLLLEDINKKNIIKIIVSGKISTAYQMVEYFALGADMCSMARAIMISAGCVQANRCHVGNCPAGIATQNNFTNNLINVDVTSNLIFNYHKGLNNDIKKLLDAMSIKSIDELNINTFFILDNHKVNPLYDKIDNWKKILKDIK